MASATINVTRTEFLPYSRPWIGEEEVAEVADSLRSGWLTTGPKTKRFEAELAAYVGARHAIAVSSCTAALHVALAAHDVGPGDEVIVPTLTFCATANVVAHLGARPVLVDVSFSSCVPGMTTGGGVGSFGGWGAWACAGWPESSSDENTTRATAETSAARPYCPFTCLLLPGASRPATRRAATLAPTAVLPGRRCGNGAGGAAAGRIACWSAARPSRIEPTARS